MRTRHSTSESGSENEMRGQGCSAWPRTDGSSVNNSYNFYFVFSLLCICVFPILFFSFHKFFQLPFIFFYIWNLLTFPLFNPSVPQSSSHTLKLLILLISFSLPSLFFLSHLLVSISTIKGRNMTNLKFRYSIVFYRENLYN